MISKIEAVVLKSIEYGETSQISSLYSRELGRISVIARGSRRPKSKFGSTLQAMSHIQAVVYAKERNQILPLSESSHLKLRRNLSRDLEKITVGLRIVELIRGLTEERDANPDIFDCLSRALDWLNEEEERVSNVLLAFQMQLAELLGIAPDIVKEAVEDIGEFGYLILESGSISSYGSHGGKRASRAALRTFAILSRSDADTVRRLKLSSSVVREVSSLVDAYFQYHFEAAYPTRSEKVTATLLQSRQ